MYDKASRGDLNVLRGDDKQANEKQLYDAFVEITDQFNDKMTARNIELKQKQRRIPFICVSKLTAFYLRLSALN